MKAVTNPGPDGKVNDDHDANCGMWVTCDTRTIARLIISKNSIICGQTELMVMVVRLVRFAFSQLLMKPFQFF